MTRLRILLIVLLFTNFAFGQENKISIGLLSSYDKFDFGFKTIDGFNHEYKTSSAYSFGLVATYNLSDRLFTKGAIQYSNKGYEIDYEFNFMDAGDPGIPKETTLELNYIGIPLFVGYNLFNGNKFIIAPSVGLINEILISDNETSVFEDNSKRQSDFLNQNLNGFLISSQINLAFNYHISDKLFLGLEPYLRIGLSVIDDKVMESNTVSYGGILSINYKLK